MAASLIVASVLMSMGYSADTNEGFTMLMLASTIISTICWVTVTLLTKPVPDDHLIAFYKRVEPGGTLWKRVSDQIPSDELTHAKPHIGLDFLNWILGTFSVWFFLFGIGRLIFGPVWQGFIFLAVGSILFSIIYIDLSKKDRP